jgi:hypothetical protein
LGAKQTPIGAGIYGDLPIVSIETQQGLRDLIVMYCAALLLLASKYRAHYYYYYYYYTISTTTTNNNNDNFKYLNFITIPDDAKNLLGCTALFLTGCRPTFHRCVLPPLSGR